MRRRGTLDKNSLILGKCKLRHILHISISRTSPREYHLLPGWSSLTILCTKQNLPCLKTCKRHLPQFSVLDFVTGNEDAVQCMPEILKDSHRCCCFCYQSTLSFLSRARAVWLPVLGLQCCFCSWLKGKWMLSISWASRLHQVWAREWGHAVDGAGVKGAGCEAWQTGASASSWCETVQSQGGESPVHGEK